MNERGLKADLKRDLHNDLKKEVRDEVKKEVNRDATREIDNINPKMDSHIEHLEPTINEKQIFNSKNIVISFVLGFMFIVGSVLAIMLIDMQLSTALIILLVVIIIYAIILFFLLEPRIVREIQKKEIQHRTIEKPVTRIVEKPVIKEVEKPVIKYVEKPVLRTRTIEKPVIRTRTIEKPGKTKTVYKKVYITKAAPKKKSNRIYYDYVGSGETKVYHTDTCRVGRSIKKKYKEFGHHRSDFTKKNYRPCKICHPERAEKTIKTRRKAAKKAAKKTTKKKTSKKTTKKTSNKKSKK